jgi:integrase
MGRRPLLPEGIEERHSTSCSAHGSTRRAREIWALEGKRPPRCTCQPTYRATVPYGSRGKRERRTFKKLEQAELWRTGRMRAIRDHRIDAPLKTTVRDAGERLLAGMRNGSVMTRSGGQYAGSVIASYESALRTCIYPMIGARRLDDIHRQDIQQIVDLLRTEGKAPSTINNLLSPLRVVFRHAVRRGEVPVSPMRDLEVPAARGVRDRFATKEQVRALLSALEDPQDRAFWAVAFYAGLRRGEIVALRWTDIREQDISVERSWCDRTRRFKEPKTRHGRRLVPLPTGLAALLNAHRLTTTEADLDQLIFANRAGNPAEPRRFQASAQRAWAAAGLEPFTPHEARHTYASLAAQAGVPIEDLSKYLGHSSITITADRYRHMYPEARETAAQLLDSYL